MRNLHSGYLPGYGHIKIDAQPNIVKIIRFGDSKPRFRDFGTYYINRVSVSKEETEFISKALKSQAGELTAADFHPEKVKEILDKVQNG